MSKTNSTIERVKESVGDVMEKAREVINDGLDTAETKFSDKADQLGRQYRRTAGQVRVATNRFSEQARGHLETAQETYRDAKKKASRWNRDSRRYVSANPAKSVLLAAGVGLLFGLVLRGRRSRDYKASAPRRSDPPSRWAAGRLRRSAPPPLRKGYDSSTFIRLRSREAVRWCPYRKSRPPRKTQAAKGL